MRPSSGIDRRARPLLGTFVEISVGGNTFGPAVEAAFRAIQNVHRLMSRQESTSDVARINRAAPRELLAIDPWTYEVLARAEELHARTDRLFDCGMGELELCERGVVRLRGPVAITLDGIAKGYAVDRAVDTLREAGVRAGVVNAGGDLRVFGEASHPIHVRHPAARASFVFIGRVTEAAVASSAWGDGRGATVIASDCTTADALTKPCLLAPGGAHLLAARFAAHALLFD